MSLYDDKAHGENGIAQPDCHRLCLSNSHHHFQTRDQILVICGSGAVRRCQPAIFHSGSDFVGTWRSAVDEWDGTSDLFSRCNAFNQPASFLPTETGRVVDPAAASFESSLMQGPPEGGIVDSILEKGDCIFSGNRDLSH